MTCARAKAYAGSPTEAPAASSINAPRVTWVAPFDTGAKQALLEEQTLAGRADLVVQLMQFQRLAPGGADIGQTLQ